MSGSYECLDNDESNESEFVRTQDRSCLRIRLSRVFSSGSLKSPKSPEYSTLSDSPKSPGRSPLSRTCYSWQSFNSEDQLPKSSISPICNVDSTLEKNIESSKNNVENR